MPAKINMQKDKIESRNILSLLNRLDFPQATLLSAGLPGLDPLVL